MFPAVSVTDATLWVLPPYQTHTAIRLPLETGEVNAPVLIELVAAVDRVSLSFTNVMGGAAAVVTLSGDDCAETLPAASNAETL